ncbi:hypothetical protein JTB14_030809 [Gonioctena quinquepunctata]|nr:hypothetical protein JTB14_030809 [Gonioctena quinquepunctata]
MNSAISEWKQMKKSDFSSRDQPLVEVACNEEAYLEETTTSASASSNNTEEESKENEDQHDMSKKCVDIDSADEENIDTDDDNLMHSQSGIEKKIEIEEQLN